jgi:hypothetical protein
MGRPDSVSAVQGLCQSPKRTGILLTFSLRRVTGSATDLPAAVHVRRGSLVSSSMAEMADAALLLASRSRLSQQKRRPKVARRTTNFRCSDSGQRVVHEP